MFVKEILKEMVYYICLRLNDFLEFNKYKLGS